MYTAYELDADSRTKLMATFPPKYQKFIGHHVTVEFGVGKETPPPKEAVVNVIGYVDSGNGLEILVCSVDGTRRRPDDGTFHITWSLDPEVYTPKDSNDLIKRVRFTLIKTISINVTPKVFS